MSDNQTRHFITTSHLRQYIAVYTATVAKFLSYPVSCHVSFVGALEAIYNARERERERERERDMHEHVHINEVGRAVDKTVNAKQEICQLV